PIYCDNRVTLSYPGVRTLIKTELAEAIRREFDAPDVVAGVATGAIAQGALVADLLGLPFVYIRPVAKDHGMGNQIEGELPAGSRVLVVEDLISTGGSSLKAVDAIRRAGCSVLGMVAVYTHGFPQAEQAFAEADVRLVTLSCYDAVIRQALATGYISADDEALLKEWRKDPAAWTGKK
ncbi:MAG: orotate phosphoribosyltransferase, partial [Porphyromonadaceae bacterium]|nr:orotate phosphoribosyltransferase [Porphyromonadaceae bacterium]